MINYLSGLDQSEIGRTKLKDKLKHIGEEEMARHKKIIEKNKALAKKLGRGIKRIAKIKKNVEFKAFIYGLKHNVAGFSTQLKKAYILDPIATKAILSSIGDIKEIIAAINFGDKFNKKQISGFGEDVTDATADTGADTTADTTANDNPTGETPETDSGEFAESSKHGVRLFKKIGAFFKKIFKRKHKKDPTDKAITLMTNSVDADSTIPKVDENGKPLPAFIDPNNEGSENTHVRVGEGKGDYFKPKNLLILGAVSIGAFILIKKVIK